MTEAAPRPVRLDVLGAGAQAVGIVIVFLSYCALPWYRGVDATRFLDVYDVVAALGGRAPVVSAAYFTWLGWALLALVALGAVAGAVALLPVTAARAGTTVVAIAGAALTVLAVRVSDVLSFGDFLDRARSGFWVAVAGYVLIALGSLSGLRRRDRITAR